MDKKLMWITAFLLAAIIGTLAGQYLLTGAINPIQVFAVVLGAMIGWIILFIIRIGIPVVDERQQHHTFLSGYLSFLFLNLLVIGALLQPWVPYNQLGLWIGVLVAGLVFWTANLLLLDLKR